MELAQLQKVAQHHGGLFYGAEVRAVLHFGNEVYQLLAYGGKHGGGVAVG